MAFRQLLVFVSVLACQYQSLLAQLPCQEQLSRQLGNQSVQVSMAGKKNQTGHWTTKFLLNKASTSFSDNWKVDFQQSSSEYGGVHNFHIKGVLTVPPKRSEDYELFPGIGYYKLHHKNKEQFSEASSICTKEGGHLAIINSEEEAVVMKILFKRNKISGTYAYVGVYDPYKNRDFVTIFGQPLNQTGYAKWLSGQPDGPSKQFCLYFNTDGLFGDIECNDKTIFFCEYDLSWSEI